MYLKILIRGCCKEILWEDFQQHDKKKIPWTIQTTKAQHKTNLKSFGSIKEIDLITYKLSKKKTLCTDGFTRKLFKTLGNNANYIQNILENTMGRNTFQFIDETTLPWHQNQRKNLQENNRTTSLMNVKVSQSCVTLQLNVKTTLNYCCCCCCCC